MDAEHRQELKTNELAENLVKLKALADKYLNTVLTVVAIVAAVFAAYRWWSWRHETAVAGAWAEVAKANVLDPTAGDAAMDKLRSVIADAPEPTVAAMARLRLATGLIDRASEPGNEGRLADAIQALEAVVNSSEADSLKGAALLKLATAYESKRDFAAARSAYQKMIDTPAYADLPYKKMAEERLKTLDEIAAKVDFTPGARPVPPPASAPTDASVAPASQPVPGENEPQWQRIEHQGPIGEHPLFSPRDPSTQPAASQPTPAVEASPASQPAEKKEEKKEEKP